VALSDAEHRALVKERYSKWSTRIEFWAVEDVDLAPAHGALADIERRIEHLLVRLGAR
jgi:hypothetical protein